MDQKKMGRLLAAQRKAKQLTQAQLAEILGVSDRSVSRWENGVTLPDASLFVPLCQALEITLDEFFAGERHTDTAEPRVSAGHMAAYSCYLTARARRRTLLLAAALTLALLCTGVLLRLCADRTFFTGQYESEFLNVTIPVPRSCLYQITGGLDEYHVKLKTLRQTDSLDIFIEQYLSTLEEITYGDSTCWFDAAQDLTILHYRANNDGIGFVNTVYITYHAGRVPGL